MARNPNIRMPLVWTATGKSMIMEDSGSCSFFRSLHTLLVAYSAATGTPVANAASGDAALEKAQALKVRLDVERDGIRVRTHGFGAFNEVDSTITYRGLIVVYTHFRNHKTLPAEARELVCSSCVTLINAIERKAPGLFFRLLDAGAPDGFDFETYQGGRHVPGQILQYLPGEDIAEIVAWSRTQQFEDTIISISRKISEKYPDNSFKS